MEKFKNKYRIPSIRLQNWNYRWAGAYFITISTQNREHYFGEIVDGRMNLSQVGVIADILWHQIPYHAKNVELGAFVVMPNHVHGILRICDDRNTVHPNTDGVVGSGHVEKGHALSLRGRDYNDERNYDAIPESKLSQTIGQTRFQNIGRNSVSSIIGSYKSAVTRHSRRLGFIFHWQPLFYDRIIRDQKAFLVISDYIVNNPSHWKNDSFSVPEYNP